MMSDGTGATSYLGTAKRNPKGEWGFTHLPTYRLAGERRGEESLGETGTQNTEIAHIILCNRLHTELLERVGTAY